MAAIQLTWTDISLNEDGYVIERSFDNVNWEKIATLPVNTTEYFDEDVLQNIIYYYRIYSFSESCISNKVYTQICVSRKGNVLDNFSADAVSVSQINLTWTDRVDNDYNYELEYSTDATDWIDLGFINPTTRSYNHTNLAIGTKYYYRISVNNVCSDIVLYDQENTFTAEIESNYINLSLNAYSSNRTITSNFEELTLVSYDTNISITLPDVWILSSLDGQFVYSQVDYNNDTVTVLGSESDTIAILTSQGFSSLGDQYLLTCSNGGTRELAVYSWDGEGNFHQEVTRTGIGNNGLNNFWTSPYYQGSYAAAGSGSYGGGVNYGTWSKDAISAPTEYRPFNKNSQDFLFDFKSTANGIGENEGYGDWHVCPSIQSGSLDMSFNVNSSGSYTSLDNHAPTYLNVSSHDRDTGEMLTTSGGFLHFKHINLTTGEITNGNSLTTGFVSGVQSYSLYKGFLITQETDEWLRTYSYSGSTVTLIDTWNTTAYVPSAGPAFYRDPYSDYIWCISNSGVGGPWALAFRLNSDGTFNKENIITGASFTWGVPFFMNTPLRCKRADDAVDWSYLTMDIAEASGDAWQDGDVIGIGETTCLHMLYKPDLIAGNLSGLVHRYPYGDDREITSLTTVRKEANSDPDTWTGGYMQQVNTAIGTKGVNYDFDTDGTTGRFHYITGSGSINRIQNSGFDSNTVETFAVLEDISSEGSGGITFAAWLSASGEGRYTPMTSNGTQWVMYGGSGGTDPTNSGIDSTVKSRMYVYGSSTDNAHYFWEKDRASPTVVKSAYSAGGGGGQLFFRAWGEDNYLTVGDFAYGYVVTT